MINYTARRTYYRVIYARISRAFRWQTKKYEKRYTPLQRCNARAPHKMANGTESRDYFYFRTYDKKKSFNVFSAFVARTVHSIACAWCLRRRYCCFQPWQYALPTIYHCIPHARRTGLIIIGRTDVIWKTCNRPLTPGQHDRVNVSARPGGSRVNLSWRFGRPPAQ